MGCPVQTLNGKNRFYVMACLHGSTGAETGDLKVVANVKNISGLDVELETSEWKTGDMSTAIKMPGVAKFPAIGLHRGYDANHFFSNWFNKVWNIDSGLGSISCATLYIYIMARDGKMFRNIKIISAWPSKYSGDDLDGSSNDVWLEKVEISHSGWKFIPVLTGTTVETLDATGMAMQEGYIA